MDSGDHCVGQGVYVGVLQLNTYTVSKDVVVSHMQSIWDSNITFSEFSDVDHPFEAEGNASVERSDWRFGLLLSASVNFSVLSSQLMWNRVTLGLDAKIFLWSWKTRARGNISDAWNSLIKFHYKTGIKRVLLIPLN